MVYVVFFCLLIFLIIKYQEQKGIYFPVREIKFYPSSVNLEFKNFDFYTADKLIINAWYIPCDQAKYTLLFCHGNAGNIMDRLDKIKLLHQIGLNILIFDYRGYGKSQGNPSEKGLYLDAQAAYEYLVNTLKVNPQEIILYGESLGSAIAIDLASSKPVAGMIIEGGFSSGRDMARKIYPFIPSFFVSNIYDSLAKVKAIQAPALFIHGSQDQVVPLKLARKLFQAANNPKEFLELPGDHDATFFNSWQKVKASILALMRKI